MGRTFTFGNTGSGIGITSISDDEHGKKIDRQPNEVAIVSSDDVTLTKSGVEPTSDIKSDTSDIPSGPSNNSPHM